MTLRFHRLAEQELMSAAAYYERQGRQLGVAFLVEVERCSEAILAHPEAGLPVSEGIRRRIQCNAPF